MVHWRREWQTISVFLPWEPHEQYEYVYIHITQLAEITLPYSKIFLMNMAPPIRTRSSFPLSQFLPSGSFHKPLILICQRADRMKTTITENKPNWSHGPQPCLTQWNCEPCPVGPPKMDRSWWRVLTKHGPLEKRIVNHFNILALRTPWTVWKGKKIGHWRMNLQVGRCPICYWGSVGN